MITNRRKSTPPKPRRKALAAPEEAVLVKERKGDRNESQTVLRACEVLKTFRNLGEELNLSQVIERTGLPKTTVFRLLRTLIHGGLLERAGSGVYRNRFGPVTARQPERPLRQSLRAFRSEVASQQHSHQAHATNRLSR